MGSAVSIANIKRSIKGAFVRNSEAANSVTFAYCSAMVGEAWHADNAAVKKLSRASPSSARRAASKRAGGRRAWNSA